MRKRKFKNKLWKFGILLIGFSLLLYNCDDDNTIIHSQKITESKKLDLNYHIETISYSDLIEDSEIKESLPLIGHRFSNQERQNISNKNSTQVAEGLTIQTEEINRITAENAITWTFSVESPIIESSDFENFLVKKYSDEFSYFLVSYLKDFENSENLYKKVSLYEISEEYLDLTGINLGTKGILTEEIDGGGGGIADCEGEVYQEIEPCDSGGYHTLKYSCQHYGCPHGLSNYPPCNDACSGTTIVTVIDFSNCTYGGYAPPKGPSNDIPDDDSNDGQTGDGSTSGGGETITSPVELEDERCPSGSGKVYNVATQKCECPDGYTEDANGKCIKDEEEDDCDTSKDDLKKIFPNISDSDAKLLASIINEKGKDFGIVSDEDLWHFLSQAGHETGGFNTLNVTESTYWTTASKLAVTYSRFTMDSTLAATNSNKYYAPDYLKNSSGVANVAMCCKFGNGNVASGDGYRYRGRGLFQLTWKENYTAFKTWYNKKYNPDIDPVTTPDIIASNDTLAILSGLWYYKVRVVDVVTIDSTTTVSKVTSPINSKLKGLKDREKRFQKAKDSINCL